MPLGGILDTPHTLGYFWILLDTWHSEVATAAVPTCNCILHGNLANHIYVFMKKPSLNVCSTLKLNCSDFKWVGTKSNIFRYEADNAKGDEKAPSLFGGRFRGYLVFDTG